MIGWLLKLLVGKPPERHPGFHPVVVDSAPKPKAKAGMPPKPPVRVEGHVEAALRLAKREQDEPQKKRPYKRQE